MANTIKFLLFILYLVNLSPYMKPCLLYTLTKEDFSLMFPKVQKKIQNVSTYILLYVKYTRNCTFCNKKQYIKITSLQGKQFMSYQFIVHWRRWQIQSQVIEDRQPQTKTKTHVRQRQITDDTHNDVSQNQDTYVDHSKCVLRVNFPVQMSIFQ